MGQRIIMSPQLSAVACTDLIVGGVLRRFPKLRVAMSEGGIGWIAPLLDRLEFTLKNQEWLSMDFGSRTPTEIFHENFLGCFISGPSAFSQFDRIGIEAIAWECDYPHSDSTWPASPELLWAEITAANLTDKAIDAITFENACRFFRFDPFSTTPRSEATVGALRKVASDVDTQTTSRSEYRRRFAETARA